MQKVKNKKQGILKNRVQSLNGLNSILFNIDCYFIPLQAQQKGGCKLKEKNLHTHFFFFSTPRLPGTRSPAVGPVSLWVQVPSFHTQHDSLLFEFGRTLYLQATTAGFAHTLIWCHKICLSVCLSVCPQI